MSEEEKKEGKKLELNLNDNVGTSDKSTLKKKTLTKEELEKIEKSFVMFLLDYQKTEKSAQELAKKLGFGHLVVAQQTVINTIDVYLKQYKDDKEKQKVK